jgi:hypothetical protein
MIFLAGLVRSDFTRQFDNPDDAAPEKKHCLAPRQSRRFAPCLAALLFGTGSAWIICLGTPNRLISCDHIGS